MKTKYDRMLDEAEELLRQAEQAETDEERSALEMRASNLYYDIEHD